MCFAPKPSEPAPGDAFEAVLLWRCVLSASSWAIVFGRCELYEPGPTCACVTESLPMPSRLSATKWWSRPVFEIELLAGLAPGRWLTVRWSFGLYAPGPGTYALLSTTPGRCMVDANEALFIFSPLLIVYMFCSRPCSSTCESYAAGPGVSSYGPVQPFAGGFVEMFDMSSVRFSVAPKPDFPAWSSFRVLCFAVDETARNPFGFSYAPGSPVSSMIDVECCLCERSDLDLNADEPAYDSLLVPMRTGLYVPGPGEVSLLRSLRAFTRFSSSIARVDGRIERIGDVGLARLDGAMRTGDPSEPGDPGERAERLGERSDLAFGISLERRQPRHAGCVRRSCGRAGRGEALTVGPASVVGHHPHNKLSNFSFSRPFLCESDPHKITVPRLALVTPRRRHSSTAFRTLAVAEMEEVSHREHTHGHIARYSRCSAGA